MKHIFSTAKQRFIICCACAVFFLSCLKTTAQIKVGNNPNTIRNASLLELETTDKGFVLPRVSLSGAINNPSPLASDILAGTVVYNTNAAFTGGVGLFIWTGSSWNPVTPTTYASSDAWKLTGNSGTSPSTNFIGTTDAQPLVLKVNGQKAGFISNSGAATSTSFGYQALNANTGNDNTATGYFSMLLNTTGAGNTASGVSSLRTNTTGSSNTATGWGSLYYNVNGNNNTALGANSLYNNISGSNNTAAGGALFSNTAGSNNKGYGLRSLDINTTGNGNIAYGDSTLITNTTGNYNTAIGHNADVTGNNLTNATAIGYKARVAVSNAMVLGNNANVGIGTSSPSNKLDVVGIGGFTYEGPSMRLYGAGPGSHTYAEFYPDGAGSGRAAWIGFGSNGSQQLSIVNQNATGDMSLNTGRDFYFVSGSTSRLMIKSNGNVGIGNTNPAQMLDVSGNVQISGAGNGLKFPDGTTQTTAAVTGTDNQTLNYNSATRVLGISGTASSTVTLPLSSSTQPGLLSGGDWATFNSKFNLPSLSNGSVLFSDGTTLAQNNSKFFWDNTNARLGIGTTSPLHPLTVQAATGNTALLGFYNNAGTDKYNFSLASGGLNLSESNVAAARLFIKDGGNVGIGTVTPNQKLEVNSGSVYTNGESTGFIADAGNLSRVGFIKYSGHAAGVWRTSTQPFEIGRVDAAVSSLPGAPSSFTTDLYVSNTGQVGIGTTGTTATLDVNGSARLRGLTAAGIVITDASGNLSSSTAASLDATTAGNGLTKSGNNIILGGSLTQSTIINQNGNDLTVQGGGTSAIPAQISYITNTTSYVGVGASSVGQSFTLTQSSTILSITIKSVTTSGTATLKLFNGNGSTATYSQTISVSTGINTYILSTSQSMPAGVNRFEIASGSIALINGNDGYAAGNSYRNGSVYSPEDFYFVVNYTSIQSSPTLFAANNGNVGIGTSSPQRKLQVYSSDGYGITQTNGTVEVGTYVDNDYGWFGTATNHPLAFFTNNGYPSAVIATNGNFGIGNNTPSYKLDVNGGIRCVGAVNTTSDARLKQNIRPIANALDGILNLRGVRYTFRQKEFPSMAFPKGEQIGVLAQEVEKVYPELVSTDDKGYKAVNYAQLTPVLIEAIKELSKQNDELKSENASVKQDVETLKAEMKMLVEKLSPSSPSHQ